MYSTASATGDLIVNINSTTPASGTVEVKYTNGKVEVSAPLWSGNIPTAITAVYDKYQTCQYLKFPIQGLLPFDVMKSDVTVKFDVWSAGGEKIASNIVWSSDWNPTNGPTMLTWLECDDWLKAGNHTLVVETDQELSTNGLLSRYVKGTQTFPFVINPVSSKSTINCVKGKTVKTVTGKNPKCPAGYKKKL